MRFVVLGILVGCGGKDGGDTGGSGTTDGNGGGGDDVVIDCSSIPQYDVSEITTCDALANALDTVAGGSLTCNEDTDCQAVHPGCQDWRQARCYYAANTCVTSAIVSGFNARSQELACGTIGGLTTEGCVCYEPPPMRCVDHECRCDPESACLY